MHGASRPQGCAQSLPPCLQPQGQALYGVEQGEGRNEFGVKASSATTNKSNFVVGGLAVPGNPYDGHTLKTALAQVRRLTGTSIDEAFVDSGYRGHDNG